MQGCKNTGELLASAILVHHANPLGVYQCYKVGMMHAYSTVEIVNRAVLIHHGDKRPVCIKMSSFKA